MPCSITSQTLHRGPKSSSGGTQGYENSIVVESSYPPFSNRALLNTSVDMEHNPSYDICNIDKFPSIKANEDYECMQYLNEMDINPSYGVHTVEN